MKRPIFFLLLLLPLFVLPLSTSVAQEADGQIESLLINFWPDFDNPSVLVLVTGQLPENSILPAEISIPVPENAEINAVANIDEAGMASVEYEASDGVVTFVTSNPRFRVEYYAPYQQDGGSRSFDFEWLSELSVNELSAEIQQPANATSLSSEPGASDVFTNQVDGLVYHGIDSRAVPAGTPFGLSFNYEMAADGLTVDPVGSVVQTTGQAVPAVQEDNNWLLIAGVLGLIALAVVGTWVIATRSSGKKSSRPQKPKPKSRSTELKATVYCHKCGRAAASDDSFCRQCGTELKRP